MRTRAREDKNWWAVRTPTSKFHALFTYKADMRMRTCRASIHQKIITSQPAIMSAAATTTTENLATPPPPPAMELGNFIPNPYWQPQPKNSVIQKLVKKAKDIRWTVITAPIPCHPANANCQEDHEFIRHFRASIRPEYYPLELGHIHMYTLDKAAMERSSVTTMWKQSQVYDASHPDGASIAKVENFLSNEGFPADLEAKIEDAECILFISAVVLHKQSLRGHGHGLDALEMAIKELVWLPQGTIAMLQAGAIGSDTRPADLAGEKLTKHWKRLGFEPWSDSDDSWLCVALDEMGWFRRNDSPIPGLADFDSELQT